MLEVPIHEHGIMDLILWFQWTLPEATPSRSEVKAESQTWFRIRLLLRVDFYFYMAWVSSTKSLMRACVVKNDFQAFDSGLDQIIKLPGAY